MSNYAAFEERYNPTGNNNIQVLGVYSGHLSNGGDTVDIYQIGDRETGSVTALNGYVPSYRVDHVNYNNATPWPIQPDGDGPALVRIHTADYGNDAINWQASNVGGTPGQANLPIDTSPPSVPAGLAGQALLSPAAEISLTWSASADPQSGVDHYVVYRNGSAVGTSTTTSFADATISAGTNYTYTVSAVNRDGYASAPSAGIGIGLPAMIFQRRARCDADRDLLQRAAPGDARRPATLSSNYTVSGRTVSGLALARHNTEVLLTLSSAMTLGTAYTVTMKNLTTVSGNQLPATQTFTFTYTAPAVTYVGSQFNIGSGWRTAAVPKTYGLNGNNVLGNDGWYLAGSVINRIPSYVTNFYADSAYSGNANYAWIDDPTTTPGSFPSTTYSGVTNQHSPGYHYHTERRDQFHAGRGRRATSRGRHDRQHRQLGPIRRSGIQITSSTGLASVMTTEAQTTNGVYNGQPDWVFFDIIGGTAGATYSINVNGGPLGNAGIGAVSFDSAGGGGIPDTTTPPAPANLRATVAGNNTQIALAWSPVLGLPSGVDHYNIYRDGSLYATSTTTSYTDTSGISAQTRHAYQVTAVNYDGLEGVKSATVTAAAAGIAAIMTPTTTSVQVQFTEPVDLTTAQTKGNYAISGGVTVSAAVLQADGYTVTLTTSALSAGSYTLTVSNVKTRALAALPRTS